MAQNPRSTAAHSRATPRWQHLHLAWLVWPLVCGLAWLVGNARAGTVPGELPALVGRLNALAGEVQLQDRDSGRWLNADNGPLRNWPVAEGDRLRLGPDGRAELRFGSTTVRLGADAQLWLQKLDEQGVVLQLQAGTAALRLAATDGDAFGPVELRTREGRWLPQRPGHYRFDRQADATQASTWRGELRFEGHDSALAIGERQRADIWLDGPDTGRRSSTRYAWAGIDRDAFADWVARDERQDDAPATARHVPPGMTGWQDLDRHGDWVSDAEHGPLWLPQAVAPGWAPYQVGRWAWVAPWGWTWIDAAPWGFAPFHYGSWLTFGGRWAWSPGPRGHHARFSPVLSGWVGRPHIGVTVQIGGHHRPPPPRVVVPVVPVVVHRPGHHHPLPVPVVVVPRPGWIGDDGPRPGRWDRHDDRRDGRADGRRDDRHVDRHDDRRDHRRDDRHVDRRDDRHVDRRDDRNDHRRDDRPRGQAPQENAAPVRPGRPGMRGPETTPAVPAVAVMPPPAAVTETPRMAVPRPVVRAPQPAEPVVSAVAVVPAVPAVAPRAGREGGQRPERADQDSRRDMRADAQRGEQRGAQRGEQRGGPSRVSDRDLAR